MVHEATAQLQALAKEKGVVFQNGSEAGFPDMAIARLQTQADADQLSLLIKKHGMDAEVVALAGTEGGAPVPAVGVEPKYLPALRNLGVEVQRAASSGISPENVRKSPDDRAAER
jgi:hypothetical protein